MFHYQSLLKLGPKGQLQSVFFSTERWGKGLVLMYLVILWNIREVEYGVGVFWELCIDDDTFSLQLKHITNGNHCNRRKSKPYLQAHCKSAGLFQMLNYHVLIQIIFFKRIRFRYRVSSLITSLLIHTTNHHQVFTSEMLANSCFFFNNFFFLWEVGIFTQTTARSWCTDISNCF